ncbi:MAG: response regulator transcription factor [Chloroflexi bacterium]|nr:response regulator transcription factor [Chloroflexota bacterium]
MSIEDRPTGRILVVEDDRVQAEFLAQVLRMEGYAVVVARTGSEATANANASPQPDLVLVDVVLPDLSGTELVRRLRAASNVPIILVTSKRQVTDKVVGLDAGADDFIPKPFEPAELLARVRAQLRRTHSVSSPTHAAVFHVGPMSLDAGTHRVTMDGRVVELSAREFAILRQLAEAVGNVVGRRELFTRVWGADFFGDEGALDVYIRRLRSKLEVDPSHPRYIQTVRGTGFRLADDPPPSAAPAHVVPLS